MSLWQQSFYTKKIQKEGEAIWQINQHTHTNTHTKSNTHQWFEINLKSNEQYKNLNPKDLTNNKNK